MNKDKHLASENVKNKKNNFLKAISYSFTDFASFSFWISLIKVAVINSIVIVLLFIAIFYAYNLIPLSYLESKLSVFNFFNLLVLSNIIFYVSIFFMAAWLAPLLFTLIAPFCIDIFVSSCDKNYELPEEFEKISFATSLKQFLSFLIFILLINLVLIPIYVLLWFSPFFGLSVIIYFVVNSYLFGREFFDLITMRVLNYDMLVKLRRNNWPSIILFGLLFMIISVIPFIQLVSPMIISVFVLHYVYDIKLKLKRKNTQLEA